MIGQNLTVLFDACVLYPAPLRDFLMRLALTGIFRARWTEQIHEEWIRNVLANNPLIKQENLRNTARLMNKAVMDSLVADYDAIIPDLVLPDADDRHVLAAAIKGQAKVIVTFNLKDFPSDYLDKFNIWAQHPDEFISYLIEQHPEAVISAAKQHRASLKKPPKSAQEFIDTLLNQQLPQTAAFLLQRKELI